MTKITAPMLYALPHLGFIRAQGPDAEAFLQGQFSNDVRLLSAQQAQIATYNSAKGRMLAVLLLTRETSDSILLQVERSILDDTLKRLRLFILRSKVTLTDVSNEVAALGLSGASCEPLLSAFGLTAPSTPWACQSNNDLQVIRLFGSEPAYAIQGSQAAVQSLRAQHTSHAAHGTEADWRALCIRNGIASVLPQTRDHFVAQMANLDLIGGISFNKGCYTGQEIVARLHYLGQLKRRMFFAHTTAAAEAGTPVYDSDHAQAVGEVVQSADVEAQTIVGIVLQLSHALSDNLRLGAADGPLLSRPQIPAGQDF